MTPYTLVDACRCCGSRSLASALDLGQMPLANAFHDGTAEQRRFPLNLMVCQGCFHGQLSVAVSPSALFTDYPYLTGISRTFREHCGGLVGEAMEAVTAPRPAVLDIGCNDGTLLSLFREGGCDVLGVDPATNLKPYTDRLGVEVVNGFWGKEFAAGLGRTFDIITAQNVFAHVDALGDFLEGVDIALRPNGVALIEFPYSADLVRCNEFDTVYHEHLNYFLANSFANLVARSPLHIVGVTHTPIHGGSLRFALRKGTGGDGNVADLVRLERSRGLFDPGTYAAFRWRVGANRAAFRRAVDRARAHGSRVAGYCASAKGTVAINYFGVDLDYVVDDTPLKQGKCVPGTRIPVVGADVLRREPNPVAVVVLAWNLLGEIRERIRSLRGGGDRLLLYVPEVREEAP